MMSFIRTSLTVLTVACVSVAVVGAQRPKPYTAPETFTSDLQGKSGNSAVVSKISIQIDRYTPEQDRKGVADALTTGGYPKFLTTLRAAPVVGSLEIEKQKFQVRYARETATAKGRDITLVTESPVYFLGGGGTNAKPREGYEIAVVTLSVDDYGLGTGRMAAAAKVRPDGSGGVLLDDYAEEPIRLPVVTRAKPRP
jgi:hypothetical protein